MAGNTGITRFLEVSKQLFVFRTSPVPYGLASIPITIVSLTNCWALSEAGHCLAARLAYPVVDEAAIIAVTKTGHEMSLYTAS